MASDGLIDVETGGSSGMIPSFIVDESQMFNLDRLLLTPGTWQTFLLTEGGEDGRLNARVGHSIVNHRKSQRLFLIGGGNQEGDKSEVWALDYSGGTLKGALHPASGSFGGRYEFACASNPSADHIWIFGGADFSAPKNDVLLFDLAAEGGTVTTKFSGEHVKTIGGDVPFPRTQGGNTTFIRVDGKECLAIYCGGMKGERAVPDGSLYLFDTKAGEWEKVKVSSDTPHIMQGHTMISIGSKIYLFGGMEDMVLFDSLYMIDLALDDKKWIKLDNEIRSSVRPSPRAAHGAIRRGNEFIIFGGLGPEGALNDTWVFSPETLEWREMFFEGPSPSPRLDFAIGMTTLETRDVIILHGGMNTEGTLFDDFWFLPLV